MFNRQCFYRDRDTNTELCNFAPQMTDFLTNVSKYDAIFSRGHFDIRLDVGKVMRGQSQRRWLLHQLEISCRTDKLNLETCKHSEV